MLIATVAKKPIIVYTDWRHQNTAFNDKHKNVCIHRHTIVRILYAYTYMNIVQCTSVVRYELLWLTDNRYSTMSTLLYCLSMKILTSDHMLSFKIFLSILLRLLYMIFKNQWERDYVHVVFLFIAWKSHGTHAGYPNLRYASYFKNLKFDK